jgi:DNA-directed RNA polymerase subunit beta
MLTIKSDDLIGRTRAYSAIIQGEPIPESNIPETFKLLVRQINGLGIGLSTVSFDEPKKDVLYDENEDEVKVVEEVVVEPALLSEELPEEGIKEVEVEEA